MAVDRGPEPDGCSINIGLGLGSNYIDTARAGSRDRTRCHPAGGYTVFSRLEESKPRESFYNILRRPLIVNRAFSLLNAPINAFTLKNL